MTKGKRMVKTGRMETFQVDGYTKDHSPGLLVRNMELAGPV